MTWKVPVFDMLYVISQPFLKISTWNFVHIFMRHCPLTYVTVFENFDLGKTVSKRKKFGPFLNFFSELLKILKIRDSSFVAVLTVSRSALLSIIFTSATPRNKLSNSDEDIRRLCAIAAKVQWVASPKIMSWKRKSCISFLRLLLILRHFI